ncbi:MAG: right-handed parallel beta-helix repeat-containing protein [Thermoguttaceae bacterium]|jgi:parallel beta-helix repeat protein|nr:right-handed parallel beta-helix repeat-containing protein [Thermoguttaceae bacterium]
MRAFLWIALLAATTAAATAAELVSLSPPVLLPNGQEFKTWEKPLAFSHTYYVNPSHPQSSDENPGTPERPLRTIDRAAQLLQPGQRVVIAAGTYRERVRPARGGSGPDRMISYEAAPGARVVLSGSRVVAGKWAPSRRGQSPPVPNVWMTSLPADFFPDENPFKEVNLTDEQIDRSMDWAIPTKGKAPNTLRRGLVFQDGQRLVQVAAYERLAEAAGRYFVEADGQTLHVRPLDDRDPGQARFEVTVQGFVFAPTQYGLGYIRVKGLSIEHAGNRFPRPQQGALSTQRGHHWIIEDCTVRQCNSIGIDIGDQFDTSGPPLAEGGCHIVRRNAISDCGIGGIEGKQIEHTLIEDNTIRRCGWHDVWRIYECGGIKVHCTRSCLVRRNFVADTIGAPGIWMDYANENSRCSGNVVVRVRCETGGIFMEASQRPNLVDNNIVWDTRGNGIYQHDCDELTIAHNLVAKSSDAAVRMQVCQGRQVMGRLSTAKRNRILNNVFLDHARPLAISDRENVCDYNVFAATDRPFDLAAWQKATSWDAHSVALGLDLRFDPETLEIRWLSVPPLPACPPVPGVDRDIFGEARSGPTPAGPFAVLPQRGARKVGPFDGAR